MGQGNKAAAVTVVVVDSQGTPVDGAFVTVVFTGDYNETVVGTTNSSGVVDLQTVSTVKGGVSFTACVDSITHASHSYASGDNVVTCASF